MLILHPAFALFVIWSFYDRFGNNPLVVEADWEYEWLSDAFGELLFFIILLAIMYLWRPNNNNSRCAAAAPVLNSVAPKVLAS